PCPVRWRVPSYRASLGRDCKSPGMGFLAYEAPPINLSGPDVDVSSESRLTRSQRRRRKYAVAVGSGLNELSRALDISHPQLVQHVLQMVGLIGRAIAFGLLLQHFHEIDQMLGDGEVLFDLAAGGVGHEAETRHGLEIKRPGEVGQAG